MGAPQQKTSTMLKEPCVAALVVNTIPAPMVGRGTFARPRTVLKPVRVGTPVHTGLCMTAKKLKGTKEGAATHQIVLKLTMVELGSSLSPQITHIGISVKPCPMGPGAV